MDRKGKGEEGIGFIAALLFSFHALIPTVSLAYTTLQNSTCSHTFTDQFSGSCSAFGPLCVCVCVFDGLTFE